MLLLKLMASPQGRTMFPYTNKGLEPLASLTYDKTLWKMSWPAQKYSHEIKMKRFFHTTHVQKDMEAAFRAIGGGIAVTGVIGPGIGLGVLFGNLASATARNPSMAKSIFTLGVMGAAFCESMALFALIIAIMVMF